MFCKITGHDRDESGMIIPHTIGGHERNNIVVRRIGNKWFDEMDAPVKAVRDPDGLVRIVDASTAEWDGPVFGGEFVPDDGAAEAVGMISAS